MLLLHRFSLSPLHVKDPMVYLLRDHRSPSYPICLRLENLISSRTPPDLSCPVDFFIVAFSNRFGWWRDISKSTLTPLPLQTLKIPFATKCLQLPATIGMATGGLFRPHQFFFSHGPCVLPLGRSLMPVLSSVRCSLPPGTSYPPLCCQGTPLVFFFS